MDKSDKILEEIKKRRSTESIIDVEEEMVKLVFFRLAGKLFAFYGSNVKEIITVQSIAYVPGVPDFILGVINVRGDVDSVVEINCLLSLPAPQLTSESRIAIASVKAVRSGILLDHVADVIDVPVGTIKPPISTLSKEASELVSGETFYNDESAIVLDVAKIFEKLSFV